MNYIVLEGVSLYLVLAMTVMLLAISLGSIICVMLLDKKGFTLQNLLLEENEKVRNLVKENFALRLKYGEFDVDEK